MLLSLQQLVPVPLHDKPGLEKSAVWKKTLEFRTPEYVFIQAPSGTGKTTLIHQLYGLRKDFTGSIGWNGQLSQEMNEEQWASVRSRDVSVIFQDLRLFPGLTAWENLEIKRTLTDTVPASAAAGWMERLGIGNKKNALASTLSYGEQQRLAIIRALLQPFHWLLMDEPFSHLDKNNTAIAAALILDVVRQNNAGIMLADLDENSFFPYTQTLKL